MNSNNVIIVGGGIAGLTAAIHLSRLGHEVTIVEKQTYPQHKVCGEYISNEVLPYLKWLDIDPVQLNATQITRTQISTVDGQTIDSKLPLGGFGISRYVFDNWLYQKAIAAGCKFIHDTVSNIEFKDDRFHVSMSDGSSFDTKIVLGAFGKRSNIDHKLNRSFIHRKSPWLAIKAHYSGDFPADLVALHNFNGGYCGVSKVEDHKINICYLASYETFKKHKNISDYEREVVRGNPHLNRIFSETNMIFEKPMTISQISFASKLPVENHILMIGDTAGLINPLCGNGMAIAIHSAKIAAQLVDDFLNKKFCRNGLEAEYTRQCAANFNRRLRTGRILAGILQNRPISNMLINGLASFPSLLPKIIRHTHGEAIPAGE